MSIRGREMAWLRRKSDVLTMWKVVIEVLFQKLFTYHLPSSHILPDDVSSLSVIVTGATSGIGLHVARKLTMAGAHVIMACRNVKAANKLACAWQEEAHSKKVLNAEVMELDLLTLSSVKRFADEWERRKLPLHVLINNAGVLHMGEPQKFSDDGIEQHIHVNHVAPAFLSLLLLPSLLRAPSARIINVNSMVQLYGEIDSKSWNNKIEDHEFSSFRAYRSSKLAHLMFLKVLASKLSDQKKASVECIAVHPGAVSTKITTGKQKEKHIFFLLTAAEGARSVLFSATSPDVGESLVNGFGYYSCDCKPSRVSPKALDNEACLDVWQKTIDILELNEDDLIRLNDE